jgi:hypothetical protein
MTAASASGWVLAGAVWGMLWFPLAPLILGPASDAAAWVGLWLMPTALGIAVALIVLALVRRPWSRWPVVAAGIVHGCVGCGWFPR